MRQMAMDCKQVFGDLLQSDFMEGDGYHTLPNRLPSPEKLKRKIIIKNKRRKEDVFGPGANSNPDFDSSVSTSSAMPAAVATATVPPEGLSTTEDAPVEVVVDGMVVKEDDDEVRERQERSGEVAKELSALVNYCTPFRYVWCFCGLLPLCGSVELSTEIQPTPPTHPASFKGFELSSKLNNCYLMSSFPEKRALRFVSGAAVVRCLRKHTDNYFFFPPNRS